MAPEGPIEEGPSGIFNDPNYKDREKMIRLTLAVEALASEVGNLRRSVDHLSEHRIATMERLLAVYENRLMMLERDQSGSKQSGNDLAVMKDRVDSIQKSNFWLMTLVGGQVATIITGLIIWAVTK